MRRRLFVIVVFVYSIITVRVMAQTVTLDYYFNHEVRTAKDGQAKGSITCGMIRQTRASLYGAISSNLRALN
jgi:hypothetical protein